MPDPNPCLLLVHGGGPEAILLLLLFGIFGCFALLLLLFWVWMIVDCATHEKNEGNEKIVWILVVVLAGWVGALIYFFARRPARKRELGR